ncbi:DNA polymerase III subunit epsilon [Polaromonas sp. P2-4]|nr:DNA polymerase III subunit epsilon [Polaromonas sp. P2-4]
MTNVQLGFGFEESTLARTPATTPKARKAKIAWPAPAPQSTPTPTPTPTPAPATVSNVPVEMPAVLEGMARALEQHPDYRVLRRLLAQTQFTHQPLGPIARVVILDTETTGLDHARDKIIELALVRVDVDMQTGQPVGPVQVYDGLQDPGMPIPKIAREITGITDAMVGGQQLDEVRIASLLEGVDLVIAHNAGFDRPFVEARLPQVAGLNWACSFADIDWTAAGRSSAKLSYLASELGWFYDAHRAEMDCHALLTVLMAEVPGLGQSGLARLIASTQTPSYRLQATGAPFDAKDLLKTRGYRWDATGKVWHTRLGSDEALQAECEWLKQAVYAGRAARLQWERHDAKSRYSSRPGTAGWVQLQD